MMSILTSDLLLPALSIHIPPPHDPNQSRNARGRHRVLPDTVVIDFPQNRRSRRSRRRRRRGSSSHNGDDDDDDDDDDSRDSDDDVRMVTSSSGRGAGNGTITSLRISPAFVRQLSEVARRTRLSMGKSTRRLLSDL
jgi:hypothetical protein